MGFAARGMGQRLALAQMTFTVTGLPAGLETECELIDEALGRVMAAISRRGWGDDRTARRVASAWRS